MYNIINTIDILHVGKVIVAAVAYYDPIQWIDPSDNLVDAIEQKVKADKSARSAPRTKGKAFIPLNELELNVIVKNSGEIIRLTEWVDRAGRFHLGLEEPTTKYRRGDFQVQRPHHNPNGVDILPPHHIHFPTVIYPLEGRSSYAHPVRHTDDETGTDYISALRLFCAYTNIMLSGASVPIIRRPSWIHKNY